MLKHLHSYSPEGMSLLTQWGSCEHSDSGGGETQCSPMFRPPPDPVISNEKARKLSVK